MICWHSAGSVAANHPACAPLYDGPEMCANRYVCEQKSIQFWPTIILGFLLFFYAVLGLLKQDVSPKLRGFDVDFLLKGTRFRPTFWLRVHVFDAFWCPRCSAGARRATLPPPDPPTGGHLSAQRQKWVPNLLHSLILHVYRDAAPKT